MKKLSSPILGTSAASQLVGPGLGLITSGEPVTREEPVTQGCAVYCGCGGFKAISTVLFSWSMSKVSPNVW